MTAFYRFLIAYEFFIYVILAAGGLFAFRWLLNSWKETRVAVYQLEREFSARRLAQSAAISVLIVALFCTEFFLATFIAPNLPAAQFLSTPTLNLLATPTGTLSPAIMTQYANLPAAAPTLGATGCAPGQAIITSPQPGEELKGTVELIGTANLPNFGFYKLEVAPIGGSNWAIFSAGSKTVKNGALGKWNTTAITPGEYQLRLVVTDNQGLPQPPCVVPVRVIPTQ